MRYDFETLVDRSHCGSGKWDGMKEKNPDVREGVVPLSVADMEFKNPPEVVEGLKATWTPISWGTPAPRRSTRPPCASG